MLLKIVVKELTAELESKIFAAAFQQSLERQDLSGVQLAHKELCRLLDCSELEFVPEAVPSPADVLALVDFGCDDYTDEIPRSKRLAGRPLPTAAGQTYYEQIAAEKTDTFIMIQLCYMRAVRLLLRQSSTLGIHEFRRQLRNMGIAYHLLNDPSSRADYDLRLLGLRTPASGQGLTVPDHARISVAGGKVRLCPEELLILTRAFKPDELLSLVNASALLSEDDFWSYLAESGLLVGHELEALIFGYRFVSHGLITIVQFELAYQLVKERRQGLVDILVELDWLDVETYNQLFFPDEEQEALGTPQIVEVSLENLPDEVPLAPLNANALPSWAQEMDWEQAPEAALAKPLEKSKKAKSTSKRGRKGKRG
ncbi:MAG: hypothetical protein K2W82_06530 [Candidatus Obscuribacterales bacterium]|nr:hypothetical protein [Candidatus Obscuribacterales bacterium]